MKRMMHAAKGLPMAGLVFLWMTTGTHAQTQRKAPAKPSATREQEDPLAPLLQQAKDAIDKMDFAAAIEPLQKYIAQRPDDAYSHFQLGYSYVGLKACRRCKSRIFARDYSRSKNGGSPFESGLGLNGCRSSRCGTVLCSCGGIADHGKPPAIPGGIFIGARGEIHGSDRAVPRRHWRCSKRLRSSLRAGRVLLRNGDAPGAESEFGQALAARADSAPAQLGLANALLAQKKYAPASDALNEYLKVNPRDKSRALRSRLRII